MSGTGEGTWSCDRSYAVRGFNIVTMSIKIAQINVDHSHTATSELQNVVVERRIDVLLLQEPYVVDGRLPLISTRFKCVYATGGNVWSAVVLVNPAIDIWATTFVDSHVVCAGLRLGNREFYVVSAYFQFSEGPAEYLNRLEGVLDRTHPGSILIGADVNARSSLWHCAETCERGLLVEDFLSSRGLVVMNEPSHLTTFESARGRSNIDVTLVSGDLVRWVSDWTVCDCVESSHRLLEYRLWGGTPNSGQQLTLARYKLKSADWEGFTTKLADLSSGFDVGQCRDVEEAVAMMTQLLHKAAEGNIRRPGPRRARYAPWWSGSVAESRKALRQAQRRSQQARGGANAEQRQHEYRVARNNYTQVIRQAKEDSW